MRKTTSLGIAATSLTALLAAGALGSTMAASAAPAEPSGRPGHGPTVLRLTAETEQFAVIDIGTPGPALGLGDQLVSLDRVLRHGEPVGRAGTVATVVGTAPNALTTQWVSTLDLLDGQLVLQGIGDGPTGPPTTPVAFTVAVTGGTGAFKNARGFADIVDRPGGVEEITVRLSHPVG